MDRLGRRDHRPRQRPPPVLWREKRILRIAASLAAGHLVDLRDAIPGLDQRNLLLVTTAIRHAAGQHHQ
jgi:hypothetical protein